MTDQQEFEKTTKSDEQDAETSDKIYFSHNNLFITFFEEKQVVESFIKNYLPEEITRNLDFNTLQIDRESFVDKRLRREYSDILYLINYKKKPAFVYILFDHKSREKKKKRKLAPFQFLRYMVSIWARYLRVHPKAEKLPPIIPIIIYHGEKKWEVSTDFFSLFEVPVCMEKYIPKFSVELCDLSQIPDEDIKGNIRLRIGLLTLKYIFNPELRHKLKDIFRLVSELKDKSSGTEYLEVLMRYMANSAAYLSEEDIKAAAEEIFEEGGDLMATIADKWKEEGIKKGIKRGIEKVVKNSLEAGIPIKTIGRITGLPLEEINRYKEKIANA